MYAFVAETTQLKRVNKAWTKETEAFIIAERRQWLKHTPSTQQELSL